MNIFKISNLITLFSSVTLIAIGFIFMKLEDTQYGYGNLALIVAPLFVVSGFILGLVSIFLGTKVRWWIKREMPFLIVGWFTFFISLIVYVSTLEETASLWDCAEFIACAYKLQVPHAPGAPLFLMIGRLFSLFAFGDTMQVAYWVNMTSALSSAFAVMFTFWLVVMLARKTSPKSSNFSLVMAGLVGSFSIAFADSFWFSAVEAETYAMATLFLIVCFWAILKWDKIENRTASGKWLIFIFYVLGLSVGVHPMALLILPAISIIVVFKSRSFSWKYLVFSVAVGAGCILFLNHVVLFGLPDFMKFFDIFFVNGLGMPFYSGAVFSIILILVFGYLVYRWGIKKQYSFISISIIGLMYFLIGYSSYFMIIIRSQANPSIDEHNPENLVTLASYLKRESYGSRPFLYGPNFDAKIKAYKKGSPVYSKMEDKYEITDFKTEYEYDKNDQKIFPRTYSNQANHISTYREWTGLKDNEKPRLMDNLSFMFHYQFGHMYLRYLMFNFSGRASDMQHAQWLSPFDWFDKVPESLVRNKARNNFFMLPFLLGIFGLFFHYKNSRVGFWAVMSCFLFLGLVLVFYLNSTPNEPRERDYIYVGSYLAFAIWIGLGAFGLYQFLTGKLAKYPWVKYTGVISIFIPLMMIIIGFDDHNRSGRRIQVDHARNTLASCSPNAILFTGGDNDTFPLWYIQEVEGFRTDVRVIVLSYFNADWYIDQMQRRIYNSAALPFSLKKEHYRQGGLNDVLPFVENSSINGSINLKRYLELVRKESNSLQVSMSGGTRYNSIPSKTFYLDIDQEKVIQSGIVPIQYQEIVPKKLKISWNGNYMEKSAIMALDLIANNNWERPIYFNITSLNAISLDLKKSVIQEGQVYRLLPVQFKSIGAVDSENMYRNLMEKWQFHDLEDDDIYYNYEDYQLRILQMTKSSYNTLAKTLIHEGDYRKANEVISFLSSHFIKENIDVDISLLTTVEILFEVGQESDAIQLAKRLINNADQQLLYLKSKNDLNSRDGQLQLFILRQLGDLNKRYDQKIISELCATTFQEYYVQD